MNTHYLIIITIILVIGSIAGVTNYLNYYFKGLIEYKKEVIKYILSGIGAATLIPLLLNMLSSDLIKEKSSFDNMNYFVFAGFCFVAGYFSDRFISSIGDKILKDLENTNNKVDQVINSNKVNEEKIDFIVSTETEIDENEDQSKIDLDSFSIQTPFADDDISVQMDNIINAFTGNFKFRTVKGISKELKYNEIVTTTILEGLQKNGVVKKLTSNDGKVLWALTKLGIVMNNKRKDKSNDVID